MNEVWTSIRRTPYQSLASFLILFFTIFLSLFFFNLTSFFNGILSYVETKPQVTVYFKTNTSVNDIFKIRDALNSSGKVLSVKYISKQDALKIYQNLNKNNPTLLEMVTADILPASLEIYASKLSYLPEIAAYLQKQPGVVDEVVFQKDIVAKLATLTGVLRKISALILIFLLLTAFIVLMTTTAFKIALKKDEIELQRLLGASTSYIRRPFLQEGVVFGLTSGTLAFLLFYLAYLYSSLFLNSYLVGISKLSFYGLSNLDIYVWPPSLNFVIMTYIITILFGVLIGFVGNFLSTSKYIK